MKTLLKAILLSLGTIALVCAQDRATLIGQVTDASGAVVPNASVKATRVDNNNSTEVKTTSGGFYTIPYLNPGVYNIEVSSPGFKTLKRTGITLQVADKIELPLR